jgi:hypothetical protein
MPPLSIWYVRSALVHLLTGFTVGGLMLANKGVPFAPDLWLLRSAHIELLLVGWLIQLAMGVAFWILPRFWQPPVRGNETGAVISLVLLNTGVWLVIIGTIWRSGYILALVGRLCEAGAAVAFASHLWPRIVPRQG